MSYLVLARKYRPQSFDAVVGQDHVTRTLINAITAGRVAHAILFTGPRGTGKTTMARILAKAMNCRAGPASEPCNDCQSCREITAGKAVDVFEIDGASNNSVDQVRELRDNVKYMPAHSLHKIYIIDEVHMLSTAAFNALLKTLEEPPAHVMFIFATTEPHKIPATILSRCQRHDFKRIALASITDHLQRLCELERFDLSRDSLTLIAREAGGSIRDALSLLDQVAACLAEKTDETQVLDLLGVIDRRLIFDLVQALLDGNAPPVLEILDDVHQRGHDLKRLYADLVEHFRHLLVVKLCRQTGRLIDLPAHEIQRLQEQAAAVSAAHLNQLFDLLFKEEPAVRFSAQPKIAVEMACFKLLQAQPTLSIDALIERLDTLRRHIAETPGGTNPRPENDAGRSVTTGGQALQGAPLADRAPNPANADPPPDAPPAAAPDRDQTWQKVQALIAARHPALAAFLLKCRPRRLEGGCLEIEVADNGFNLAMIRKDKNLEIIRGICREVCGRPLEITLEAVADPSADGLKKKEDNQLRNEAMSHPLVTEAVKIFDGEVLGVTLIKEDES
ncbi:MAG: DNA polymerase III subunit gamma/tau [Desulfobacterales bacterium]